MPVVGLFWNTWEWSLCQCIDFKFHIIHVCLSFSIDDRIRSDPKAVFKYSGGEMGRREWLGNLLQRKTRVREHVAPPLLFADCDTRTASSPIPGSFSLFFIRPLCAAKEKRETWARGKITGAPRRASTYATGYQNILSTNVSLVIDNSFSPCTSHFHSTTGRADQSPLSYLVLCRISCPKR